VTNTERLDGCARRVASAREVLISELREHALVIGEVKLTSGAVAPYYVDAKRAILRPACFLALGELVFHYARRFDASAVGGVPISAIPVACAGIAAAAWDRESERRDEDGEGAHARTLTKAFIVRKERKEHGLGRLIEGPELDPGERCLVVEDVVTTGGSTVELLERLRDEDLAVAGVVCVLDRLAGGAEAIRGAIDAPYVAITTIDDVYPERPDR
jgi:orotate phosphoribosyltransferase